MRYCGALFDSVSGTINFILCRIWCIHVCMACTMVWVCFAILEWLQHITRFFASLLFTLVPCKHRIFVCNLFAMFMLTLMVFVWLRCCFILFFCSFLVLHQMCICIGGKFHTYAVIKFCQFFFPTSFNAVNGKWISKLKLYKVIKFALLSIFYYFSHKSLYFPIFAIIPRKQINEFGKLFSISGGKKPKS